MKMRRLIAVLSLSLMISACANNPKPAVDATVNLSSSGQAAFTATKVVKALDVLRDVAIDAEKQTPKLLSTENTRKVVRYHESAVKAIGAVPGGWKPVVTKGLDELAKQIPPNEWGPLEPFAGLIRAVLEGVQ